MSYSFSYTESSTFTVTHARHMAAKVATDLKRMQRFYGSPSNESIASYEAEATEMIRAGYLGTVTYGFKKDGNWIEPTLRYTARDLAGALANDDDPGRIRPGADWGGHQRRIILQLFDLQRRVGPADPDAAGHIQGDAFLLTQWRRRVEHFRISSQRPHLFIWWSSPRPRLCQELLMNTKPTLDELFERRITYPDFEPQSRLALLVGLDDQKSRLAKILSLLVNPGGLADWAQRHHPGAQALLDTVLRRPPLVILAGDVGSGKTELAETIGDAVARQEKIGITLLPLSLSTRGQGRVGEMTQLLSAAFDYMVAEASRLKSASGKARGAVILLVDEADALAQSREAAQMHHEDRAGVNAFIRGIDRIANAKLPAAVLMCTNRLSALDPAARRRAADVLSFARPSEEQRRFVLTNRLEPIGLGRHHVDALVTATGPQRGARDYGFTFSDLTQRLLPAIVLDAYPSKPVAGARAVEIARAMLPTP